MDRAALQVIPGGPLVVDAAVRSDPAGFQSGCVDDYWASCVARGFSAVTIENDAGVLERVLALLGRPAWDVTAEDVDRVVGGLAADGLASSTRRGYVQAFKGFHRFLQSRKAVEIDALFGVRLVCPVDEFNASRHVGDESSAVLPPPTPERVTEFFEFLKGWIATARKYAPIGPGLRVVPDVVSRWVACRGVVAAGTGGYAFHPRAVRQVARPLRQGSSHVRAAAAVGADARRVGSGAALVRAGRPGSVPGLTGVVSRRIRAGVASGLDP